MDIGARIKERRLALGLPVTSLAERTGIGRVTLTRYEAGTVKNITEDRLARIAEVLQVSLDYLRTGKSKDNRVERLNGIFHRLNDSNQLAVIDFSEKRFVEQELAKDKVAPLRTVSKSAGAVAPKPKKWKVQVMNWRVSAGTGLFNMDECMTEGMEVTVEPPSRYDNAWLVSGDSMLPLFEDEEIIYTKKVTDYNEGDFMVICVDDELFVKKVSYAEDALILKSLNPLYKDIRVTEDSFIQLIGRVILR